MHYLGIDYGTRHVGLAIGDETGMSLPLDTIENTDEQLLLDAITHTVKDHGIDHIIIGIPRLGSGHTEQEVITQAFITKLQEHIKLPIDTIDESFTSLQANQLLREASDQGANHALAAMVILQNYLDRKHR